MIIKASGDLGKISKGIEALMFAVYLSSVTSLSDEDCQNMMGEHKTTLLARFSNMTQQALTNAEVLRSSDISVLQALTLFLVSFK
jgi:hypothetical protein